jgi:hypothetical protein
MSIFDSLGGTNKFKKGMEAGAKPFAAKFEQHAEELKRLERNFGDGWKQTKEVADVILNQVEDNEKARLYGLYSQIDIKGLKQEYKEFIVAVLYTLSPETSNELQQSYIRSVQKYLGIKIPQTNIEFSALENIDNLTAQKTIFQVCVEYLFLANNNLDFFDQYEESLFSYFSLKDTVMLDIWENVLQIYTTTGPLGLAEKYGFVPKPSEGKSDVGAPTPIELEDEIIENDIHILAGEGRKFQAKNIRLNADIHCDGELAFENCVIVYSGDDIKSHILMRKNTSLTMSHCTFVGMNNEKRNEDPESYLIQGDYRHSNEQPSKLFIEDCLFFNCLCFAKGIITQLTNCIVRYAKLPLGNQNTYLFDCVYESNSKATGCLFESLETEDDMAVLLYLNYMSFNNGEGETLTKYFKLNTIEEVEKMLLERFKLDNWDEFEERYRFRGDYYLFSKIKMFSRCTFKNITNCFSNVGSVSHCQFINCISIMKNWFDSKRDLDVSNCSFVNCVDIVQIDTQLNMSNCQFLDCSGPIMFPCSDSGINILLCQFYRINGGRIMAGKFGSNKSGGISTISKCLFDGIFVPKGTNFISAQLSEKNIGIRVTVDECEFKHCIAEDSSSKIIEREPWYEPLFGQPKRATTIEVRNCRGLENVNKEGELTEEIVLKQETATGQPIGTRLDEAWVGVPGYTPNFVIVN